MNEKLEWIRLKKKLDYITDLDPLILNIEGIFNLPENLKIAEDNGSVPDKNIPFNFGFEQNKTTLITVINSDKRLNNK